MARRLTANPLPAWVGDLPVFERVLDNGLKALVLPRKHAPVVVCDLFYPVGSVDEPPGRSGLAHFVEHMLFKGTAALPKGYIDQLAFRAAGHTNAETGEDFTHYWFAFPRERWELALAIEADRMHGAAFDPLEVEAERHVIAEERAHDLDSPQGRLDQQHLALSYLVHPYRNPVLGWPDDVRRTTVEDLTAFYREHYRPDGAVLVIVGDVEPKRALARVAEHFGTLPAGERPRPTPITTEPPQTGRRAFSLAESGESALRGMLGWHSVPRGHADAPALGVLADLLSCGRRSRLWDRLVEADRVATHVDAAQEGSHLAGQFLVQIEAPAAADPEKLEAIVAEEIARLAESGPSRAELSRSRHRLEAAWRWEQEDLGGLALGLGQVALWGDWRQWQAEHRAALAVTAADVRRVAATYLVESGLTVGWSLPRSGNATGRASAPVERPQGRPAIPRAPEVPTTLNVPGGASKLSDYRPRRSTLPNGLTVLTERRPGTGTVALELHVDSGSIREAKPGVATLVGRLREEGTLTRTAEDLAEAVEDVGGVLDIHPTGLSMRVRAEDLPLAVELMADVTLRPAFPEEAWAWTRRRSAAELQADLDDPSYRAELAFRGLVYGDHPLGRDPRGSARALRQVTLDDVREHHDRYFKADNAVLVAAGDFDPRRLAALARRHLGGWEASGRPLPPPPMPQPPGRPRVRRLDQPGEQVHILIGQLGIPRNHPDHDALAVLDHILGSGPGFTDRLSRVLRDEMGLAYSVGGGMTDSADILPGALHIYIGTSPESADRAVAAALEQIEAMHRGDFSDEEVERARHYLAGSWVFDYQTVGQRAERLLDLQRWGLPLDEPLNWPDRVGRVTPGAVRQAARRHIDPARLMRVEYGPLGQRSGGRRRTA